MAFWEAISGNSLPLKASLFSQSPMPLKYYAFRTTALSTTGRPMLS